MRSTGSWSRGRRAAGSVLLELEPFRHHLEPSAHRNICKNNGHFQTGISNTTNHQRMVKQTESSTPLVEPLLVCQLV